MIIGHATTIVTTTTDTDTTIVLNAAAVVPQGAERSLALLHVEDRLHPILERGRRREAQHH